jgi:hypothetical protein
MLFHQLFFFILSLVCTLTSAAPAPAPHCPVRYAPVNGAAMRNMNGSGGTFFDNHVAITITQAYREPSPSYPWGGVGVRITNAYCFRVTITFTYENGHHYDLHVGSYTTNLDLIIPEGAPIGHVLHVSVEADWGL